MKKRSSGNADYAFRVSDLGDIDEHSRIPIYLQISEKISRVILKCQKDIEGFLLPPELACMQHFGVSRPTMRQAIAELQNQGLVVRQRGRGTFVAPALVSNELGRTFETERSPASHRVSFHLLAREKVAAPARVSSALRMRGGVEVVRITRLRSLEGQVFGYEERYFVPSFADKLTTKMLGTKSGAEMACAVLDEQNCRMTVTLRSQLAKEGVAEKLKVNEGTAILESEHTYFTSEGDPFSFGSVYFVGDRYEFKFQTLVHA